MDTWNLMHDWHYVLPPSRPSAWQLRWISDYLDSHSLDEPVAILGSTPEFRDLLHELGFKDIFVFDKNDSFFQKMSETRIYRNPETYISGNWIQTLPRYKGCFGMILSDLTSGNIPYTERAYFYEVISDTLLEGGVFFDKILTHPGELLLVEQLMEKYARLPLNLLYINHFSCEMLFCSELLDIKYEVDSSLFYSILAERIKNQRVLAFLRNASKITPMGCRWYYGKRWKELEKDYCPNLKVISLDEDEITSPYYGRAKYYLLKKE